MSAPIRLLSFDLDGTLYKVRRFRVAWRLRYERGLLLALLAAREKIRHEPPLPDMDALKQREAELVAPSFGLTAEETLERLSELRKDMPWALTGGARPYPGVRGALEAAAARGLKLAVLSDYDPDEKLENLGLADLPWVAVIGAEHLGALKPHPDSFLELARRAKVAPSQVLHIGDREDLDVDGALAAGMRAWRKASKKGLVSRSEHVFDRYTVDLFLRLLD